MRTSKKTGARKKIRATPKKRVKKKPWFVYLVRCADLSIYTGITDNVTARIDKHNNGRGARYTAQRRPVTLIYEEEHPDQGSAMKREAQIKTWPKERKERLAQGEFAT